MSDRDTFERTLATMYDAMRDDARWPAASARIDEACGIEGNHLRVGEGPMDDRRVRFVGIYSRGRRPRRAGTGRRPGVGGVTLLGSRRIALTRREA